MRGSEPGERRGGRQKGTPNVRTVAATELLRQAQDRFPEYNPIEALIALGEASDDPALKKECHAALLPYFAPKFRPIVADPDEVVDLEGRIAAARLEAQAAVLDSNPGIADRLARAMMRSRDEDLAFVAANRPVVVDMTAAPEPPAKPKAPAVPSRGTGTPPASTLTDWEEPKAPLEYQPVLAPYPERQAFVDDYTSAPGTLLSSYRDI